MTAGDAAPLSDYTSGIEDITLDVSGSVHQMQGLVALVGDPIPVLLTDEGADCPDAIIELINPAQRAVLVARLRSWADALDPARESA